MMQSHLHIINRPLISPESVDFLSRQYRWQSKPMVFDGAKVAVKELREFITYCAKRPLDDMEIIMVITGVEMLRGESANTMLKILEEPPPYLSIHLITNNEARVIATIVSRCHRVRHNSIDSISDDKSELWQWDKMSLVEKLRWCEQLSVDEDAQNKIANWLMRERKNHNWLFAREIEKLLSASSTTNVNKRLLLENFVLSKIDC